MTFDVRNWYWIADDGRVFGSVQRMVVTEDDPDYVAWVGKIGERAYPWPRDVDGNQTEAALLDMLGQFNVQIKTA
ncbi:hypothetical protein AAFX91_14100 [Bradyrhizobium sp. 31Argb]|uniref:hypothetical protein n=1 Tax=unclassified Bradyrhizobium TaxID=2631580 RepID=UPI00102E6F17|nr:hypothetical protein [Bradyrhizobium sp. Leo170]TAI63875.1 hypothetical protein CWO89_21820 [Bradyrhizobium sp. Leo170]